MAKSARASRIKTNKQKLKKRVFAPVELARNTRLNARLQELINKPKPVRAEMEVVNEESKAEPEAAEEDADMDVDGAELKKTTTRSGRSNTEMKKMREAKTERVEKKRHRKTTNRIAFPKHPKKGGKK